MVRSPQLCRRDICAESATVTALQGLGWGENFMLITRRMHKNQALWCVIWVAYQLSMFTNSDENSRHID